MIMKFDFEQWKNKKVVMHCKTEEEAIEFCNIMHEHGLKWGGGSSYLEFNNWRVFKERTCYNFNAGAYSPLDFYKQENYTILKWSDYSTQTDCSKQKEKEKTMSTNTTNIEKVIFNGPATIILWGDNTRNVVKLQNGDEYDKEKDLAMALLKKAYGNDICLSIKKSCKKGSKKVSTFNTQSTCQDCMGRATMHTF